MKKKLIVIFLILPTLATYSQSIDAESMINLLSISDQKLTNQVQKKGFKYLNAQSRSDTNIKIFSLHNKTAKTQDLSDTLDRNIIFTSCKSESTLTYQTESFTEISNLKEELKLLGFYTSYEEDSSYVHKKILFQHLNFIATIFESIEDQKTLYSIKFHKKIFPDSKTLYYADDLLLFTSHEYLTYYFGEENVKKDIYIFNGNEISKCSVLFAGTNRQVVFIWEDEVNKCTISNLLFGGQQKLKSSNNKDKFISESSWLLKSGLYAGMTLYELRKLNGVDFNFYAGKAINSGLVLEDSKGNVNFKKENIILGCINCTDNKYRSTPIMSVDKALEEDRIMFVLSLVLTPVTDSYSGKPNIKN
jgi:hypothetical protein